ncbi:MAG: HAD-IIIC family phosphatase [Desulfovibrionaceae bacterium]
MPQPPTMLEALQYVKNASGDRPHLRLAVLRTVTMEPMEAFLRYEACRAGWDARVVFGGFDTMLQDLHGPFGRDELPGADCVIVAASLASISPRLTDGYARLGEAGARAEEERVAEHLAGVLRTLRARTDAPVLVQLFEQPVFPILGIGDPLQARGQRAGVAWLNEGLRALAASLPNTYCVDVNDVMLRAGAANVMAPRQWYGSRTPYTPLGFALLAQEYFKYVRAIRGQVKKCLVLDCDNVLWGGIVGEDGPEGIRLGPDHKGEPYLDFQRAVLDLSATGVIIALCSKNNAADVMEVLEKHPHMLLRDEHVAAYRINWRDKPANLRELARELNIGLGSMVFMDDSAFEIEAVRMLAPEVEAVHLSADHPENNVGILRGCGLFDRLSLSSEDRQRGTMYKAQVRRNTLRQEASSLDAYLGELAMRATLGRAGRAEMPRVAQLAQRTNQFNLTTRRHTEDDVAAFAARGGEVVYLDLEDRLGPLGIIGACMVDCVGDEALIDSFFLSCRAIGRTAETLLLDTVLGLCAAKGMRVVRGEYIPTAKNSITATFYPDHGFAPDGESGEAKSFVMDLAGWRARADAPFAVNLKL